MHQSSAKIPSVVLLALVVCVVACALGALLLIHVPVVPGVLAAAAGLAYFALILFVPAAMYSIATDPTARSPSYISAAAAGALLVLGLLVAPFLGGGI